MELPDANPMGRGSHVSQLPYQALPETGNRQGRGQLTGRQDIARFLQRTTSTTVQPQPQRTVKTKKGIGLLRTISCLLLPRNRTIPTGETRNPQPLVAAEEMDPRSTIKNYYDNLSDITSTGLARLLRNGIDSIPPEVVQTINMDKLKDVDLNLKVFKLCSDINYSKLSPWQQSALELERKIFESHSTIEERGHDLSLLNNLSVVERLPVDTWSCMTINFRTTLLNHFWTRIDPKIVEMIITVCDVNWHDLDPELVVISLNRKFELTQEEADLKHKAQLQQFDRSTIQRISRDLLQKNYNDNEGANLVAKFLNVESWTERSVCYMRSNLYREAHHIVDSDLKMPLNNFNFLGLAIAQKLSGQPLTPLIVPEAQETYKSKNDVFLVCKYSTVLHAPCYIVSKTTGGPSVSKANKNFLETLLEYFKKPFTESHSVSYVLTAGTKAVHESADPTIKETFSHVGLIAQREGDLWIICMTINGNISVKAKMNNENVILNPKDIYKNNALGYAVGQYPNLENFSFHILYLRDGDSINFGEGHQLNF